MHSIENELAWKRNYGKFSFVVIMILHEGFDSYTFTNTA